MMFDERQLELPPDFAEVWDSIRKMESQARIVGEDGNFVLIWIGEYELPAIAPGVYKESCVNLFVRVPKNFYFAVPYGVITIPRLNRVDDRPIDRQHTQHGHLDAFRKATGLSEEAIARAQDACFISWEWKNMPKEKFVDAAHVIPWALKLISEG